MAPYPAQAWSWTETQLFYREMRQYVEETYGGKVDCLTGMEMCTNGVRLGHWAISRLILEPERHVQRSLLPLQLRKWIEQGNPHVYGIPLPPTDSRRRRTAPDAVGQVGQHRVRKGKHVMFQATQAMPLPPTPEFLERDRSTYTQQMCVQGCSVNDIRSMKKILKLGNDIQLESLLPNGQTAAAFATQYVYNEGMKRFKRKRTQKVKA